MYLIECTDGLLFYQRNMLIQRHIAVTCCLLSWSVIIKQVLRDHMSYTLKYRQKAKTKRI